ncbi:uncharacterized protein [Cherax quadricarinatus]
MADHPEDNDPFEEDIVFDEAGLLGGKMPRSRQQSTVGFLPTFMLFIRTVFLCTAFVALGLCVSVSGGPLIRLEVGIGVPLDTAFHTFTARSFGMLLGGILGSLLFEVYNRQFLIFVSLVWVAVSVTMLPFTVPTALWWTFLTTAALGLGLGFLFTGGNVLCLDLWGRQGGASLQALHFSFAVGAFVVPLVIQPLFVGLQPMVLRGNQSDAQDLATDTTDVLRLIRGLPGVEPTDNTHLNSSFFDLESLSRDDIIRLTLPQTNATNGSFVDTTANATWLGTSVSYDGETPSPPGTIPAISATVAAPNISSTVKTPKMKPSYTDANRLEPDSVKVWKKPAGAAAGATAIDTKPKLNSPIVEEKKDSGGVASTPVPDVSSLTTLAGQAAEVSMPVLNTQQVTGGMPDNHTHTSSVTSASSASHQVDHSASDTTAVDGSSAAVTATVDGSSATVKVHSLTTPVTSIQQTASSISLITTDIRPLATTATTIHPSTTTYTTTTTTTAPSTTTTTTTVAPSTTTSTTTKLLLTITSLPSTATTSKFQPITTSLPSTTTILPDTTTVTPTSKYLKLNNYEIEFPEIDMTSDTDSLIYGNKGFGTLAEQPKESIEDEDAIVPEPELLDLKEPIKYEPEDLNSESDAFDNADTSDTSSLIHHQSKPGTFSNGSDENNQFLDDMALKLKNLKVTKVHLAYICIGIFIILNALISVVILCHNPRETRSKQDDGNLNKMQKGRIVLFTIVFSVFMFMAEALQGAVHHLLASSATGAGLDVVQESKIDGQVLFWGLVCLVRFLCILVSGCLHLKPGKLLVISVLLSFIGSVFLSIGSFGKEDFLWGGIVFLAIGLAPVLPTSLLWMAQYMRVTHRMCALMIVLASFGNSLTHSLLTRVAGNSHAYSYILVTISFVSLFFLFLSMCVLYTAQRSKTLGVPVGYQLASQHEEEDSIELTPSGSAVFTPNDSRARENGEAGQSLLID